MNVKQATAQFQKQIIEAPTPQERLLWRYELRLFRLSQHLTLSDWAAIRGADYWQKMQQILATNQPEIEKEIAVRKLLGCRIRDYLNLKQ